ncbi:hypothetical protein MMC22_002387 [Lobaria immixta]|nr:hypothetical protein [Lobaria immixta]
MADANAAPPIGADVAPAFTQDAAMPVEAEEPEESDSAIGDSDGSTYTVSLTSSIGKFVTENGRR